MGCNLLGQGHSGTANYTIKGLLGMLIEGQRPGVGL